LAWLVIAASLVSKPTFYELTSEATVVLNTKSLSSLI
jgi:hypothetical protein